MASRFIEITDFSEALKYIETGLLVSKEIERYSWGGFWKPADVGFWPDRGGTYGILVEEDTTNSE